MISCILSVCSEALIIDHITNSVSLINVLEQIRVDSFPIVLPKLFCLFEFLRGEGDPEKPPGLVTLKLGNLELFRAPCDVDFQQQSRTRTIINIQSVVIPGPGVLRVSIDIDGITKGNWDIDCEGSPRQITLPWERKPRDESDTAVTSPPAS